jgi:mono/diheme cytochrome c family protein
VLFSITRYGLAAGPSGYVTDKPAFADPLSDHETAAISVYIKSTWPKDNQARQMEASNRRHSATRPDPSKGREVQRTAIFGH